MHHGGPRDYSLTPLNIYWETTQACGLACRHCRAEALPEPPPGELTHDQSLAFLRQIPAFGHPLPTLILTGGDPLERPDLYPLIDEARRLGIQVSITPAATAKLTREVLAKLQSHGVEGLGLSLDGATAAHHDGIRGVPGTFDRTLQALAWAQELGLPVQVNSLACRQTVADLPAIYELLKPYAPARWSIFFLISVGRGKVLEPLSPEEAEQLMHWIASTSRTAPFTVATTEAPSYRRVAIESLKAEGLTGEQIRRDPAARGFGIRDGNGIVFVASNGDVCPAGFLPLPVGNIKERSLVEIYRHDPLFESLHDPNSFEGRCGYCEYHALCGGSRSRAFSATGNPLATDPLCLYEPHAHPQEHAPAQSNPSTPSASPARVG